MEEEFKILQGLIRFKITQRRPNGASLSYFRYHYFCSDEKPVYDFLKEFKSDNTKISAAYWHNEPTTQSNLVSIVGEPALVEAINEAELEMKLRKMVVILPRE